MYFVNWLWNTSDYCYLVIVLENWKYPPGIFFCQITLKQCNFISILENVQGFLILSGDVLIIYCISMIMVGIDFAKTVVSPVC